jgi:hypothetical protein
MKTNTTLALFAVLAGSAVLVTATDAPALGPLDLEVGAKVGVGTTPSNIPSGAPNPLGFGLGARAGVSILGFYGGGSIVYYLGGSQNVPTPGLLPAMGSTSISEHTLMYGFEGGYGIKLIDILTLRAQVGVGSYDVNVSGGGSSSDTSNLYVEPGVTAMITLPIVGWFVGADANALVLTGAKDQNGNSATDLAFTLHGQVGYTF